MAIQYYSYELFCLAIIVWYKGKSLGKDRYLKSIAGDGTGSLVAVLHVVDVTQKLELVIHGGDDGVETISDQSDLFVVFGITGQGIDGNSGELGEVLLGAGRLLEEPVDRNK